MEKLLVMPSTEKRLISKNTRDTFIRTKKKIATLNRKVYKEATYSRGKSHDYKHTKKMMKLSNEKRVHYNNKETLCNKLMGKS